MPFTRYAENKFLNEAVGRTGSFDFGNVYLGLSTTTPTESGDTISNITEPSGNGYARKLIGNYAQSETMMFGAASGGVISNSKQIQFDMATGSWGTCTYAVFFDNTGNAIAYGLLVDGNGDPAPITPVANSVPLIPVGGVVLSFDRD